MTRDSVFTCHCTKRFDLFFHHYLLSRNFSGKSVFSILHFVTSQTETATEKINNLHIDFSVHSTPAFSLLDGQAKKSGIHSIKIYSKLDQENHLDMLQC